MSDHPDEGLAFVGLCTALRRARQQAQWSGLDLSWITNCSTDSYMSIAGDNLTVRTACCTAHRDQLDAAWRAVVHGTTCADESAITTMAEPTPLEQRKIAEDAIALVLSWPEPWIALLLDQLLDKGNARERWDMARARAVLKAARWAL